MRPEVEPPPPALFTGNILYRGRSEASQAITLSTRDNTVASPYSLGSWPRQPTTVLPISSHKDCFKYLDHVTSLMKSFQEFQSPSARVRILHPMTVPFCSGQEASKFEAVIGAMIGGRLCSPLTVLGWQSSMRQLLRQTCSWKTVASLALWPQSL